MSLITRQGKGSKLTIQEMDGNLEYLEGLAQGGGTIPVETVYPTTDALKAGTRFWYKGNEWHYMTQAEIDSTGWTGLVSVGFPAPVDKTYNNFIIATNCNEYTLDSITNISIGLKSDIIDFVGFGTLVNKSKTFALGSYVTRTFMGGVNVTKINGTFLLQSLEDIGTLNALSLTFHGLSEEVIDDLFTQLPPTNKTATINVSNNPGAATCDPTIATSKGYIVVT
jgi:hypothetical protein